MTPSFCLITFIWFCLFLSKKMFLKQQNRKIKANSSTTNLFIYLQTESPTHHQQPTASLPSNRSNNNTPSPKSESNAILSSKAFITSVPAPSSPSQYHQRPTATKSSSVTIHNTNNSSTPRKGEGFSFWVSQYQIVCQLLVNVQTFTLLKIEIFFCTSFEFLFSHSLKSSEPSRKKVLSTFSHRVTLNRNFFVRCLHGKEWK